MFNDVGVKVPVVHYVPEYYDVPLYIEMPPANDIIKRNVKDIYINPKDYIKEASVEKKDEKVSSCANCRSGRCYGCFGGSRA